LVILSIFRLMTWSPKRWRILMQVVSTGSEAGGSKAHRQTKSLWLPIILST